LPHDPQLLLFVAITVQTPLQTDCPAGHEEVQAVA
jgi:hypothetical protein